MVGRWTPGLWQDNPTTGDPPHFTMLQVESLLLSFDPTELLIEEDPAANPVSTLRRLDTDATVDLDDEAELQEDGTITQRLRDLERGVNYLLEVAFETGDNTRAIGLYIRVI